MSHRQNHVKGLHRHPRLEALLGPQGRGHVVIDKDVFEDLLTFFGATSRQRAMNTPVPIPDLPPMVILGGRSGMSEADVARLEKMLHESGGFGRLQVLSAQPADQELDEDEPDADPRRFTPENTD